MDLNLLTAFDALVEESSVTAAAARLHLSVPAASRALGRLRRAMDDPILVRAGRGLVPTPFALRIAPQVRTVLDGATGLLHAERDLDPATLRRTFTVRISDGTLLVLGSALVAGVASAAPGVTIRFAAEGEEDPRELRDGRIDLDIGMPADGLPDLREQLLYDDRLVGVVRADSTFGRRRPTPAALASRPHVVASRRGHPRGPLDEALERHGVRRSVAAVVPSHSAAAFLAAQSDLIALVPARLARQCAESLRLRSFAVPVDIPAVPVSMQWHVRLDGDPAHRWFRACVRSAAAESPTDRAAG